MRSLRRMILVLVAAMLFVPSAHAAFNFSDERFQGVFTTENLDAMIQEYELFDGW